LSKKVARQAEFTPIYRKGKREELKLSKRFFRIKKKNSGWRKESHPKKGGKKKKPIPKKAMK